MSKVTRTWSGETEKNVLSSSNDSCGPSGLMNLLPLSSSGHHDRVGSLDKRSKSKSTSLEISLNPPNARSVEDVLSSSGRRSSHVRALRFNHSVYGTPASPMSPVESSYTNYNTTTVGRVGRVPSGGGSSSHSNSNSPPAPSSMTLPMTKARRNLSGVSVLPRQRSEGEGGPFQHYEADRMPMKGALRKQSVDAYLSLLKATTTATTATAATASTTPPTTVLNSPKRSSAEKEVKHRKRKPLLTNSFYTHFMSFFS